MKLKNMPTWLKTALIFSVAVTIILFGWLLIESLFFNISSDMGTPALWAFLVLSLPVIAISEKLTSIVLIIPTIEFFVLGAIIGWIYGKLR